MTVQQGRLDLDGSPNEAADGNDVLVNTTAATGTIVPALLTVNATVLDKTYNATTAATVALGDRVPGDTLALRYGMATFVDKNVGAGKAVNVGGIAASGADAGNYRVATTTTATGNVVAATLSVRAVAS